MNVLADLIRALGGERGKSYVIFKRISSSTKIIGKTTIFYDKELSEGKASKTSPKHKKICPSSYQTFPRALSPT